MAQLNLTMLVIFLFLYSTFSLVEPSLPKRAETLAYIRASCQTTRYPDLCIQCLSKFANSSMENPQQLAHIALSVSLSKALYTRAYLLEVAKQLKAMKNNTRDYLAVQDCLRQINDSVDQLSQAIKELRQLNSWNPTGAIVDDKFLWHISNVETWVSTALTDASSCVESFPGQRMSKLKASIRVRALNVVEATSNALALFHGYAARYRVAARATKKP